MITSITDAEGNVIWDSEHVADGLNDFLISFEMVLFAIAHRYAFPHTDYLHYLQRHRGSTLGKQSSSSAGGRPIQSEETLLLFDQDHNAVSGAMVDVEYEPPTVRQLDRPMSVSRALLGVVPNETISDIARMSMSGRVVDSGARGTSSRGGLSEGGGDIVFSRDHAEGI